MKTVGKKAKKNQTGYIPGRKLDIDNICIF